MRRLLLASALVLAGCGAQSGGEGTQDLRTGLRFAVKTTDDPAVGRTTTLTVSATRDLPAGVRAQLEGERLEAICRVPGARVVTIPRVWPDLDEPYVSRLQTRPDVSIADEATSCELRLGGRTFSSVDLR